VARGFESKSVESQQEEAARKREKAAEHSDEIADRAAAARRHVLELARARAEADLKTATRPAHRQMLQRGLASLEAELAKLDAAKKDED
jgi:cell division septum initiation protein DivIVA